jgi:hypothetical protein
MARQTSAEKVTRFRQRQAGLLPALPLCCCGRQIRSVVTDGLCSRCWKKSPAGQAADALRKRSNSNIRASGTIAT